MGGLFGGGSGSSSPTIINSSPLPTPRPQRMPSETDPAILAAAERTRKAALQRTGRLSTILTDNSDIGSSGQKLGA